MYRFHIKYESYLGLVETLTIIAETEDEAIRKFRMERPLSDIIKIEKLN